MKNTLEIGIFDNIFWHGQNEIYTPAVDYPWKMVIASKHETLFHVLRIGYKLNTFPSYLLQKIILPNHKNLHYMYVMSYDFFAEFFL